MLFFTQNDVETYITAVIGHIATLLNVSPNLDAIRAKNAAICAILETFIHAYRAWHRFHVFLDSSEKTSLSIQEDQTLRNLIQSRDFTRENLITEVSNALSIAVTIPFDPTDAEAQQDQILEERLETLFGQK